jgi:hypothetical protein
MTRFSRLIVFGAAASLLWSPVSAQLLGGGGGPVGGIVGGVTGALGNTAGQVGGMVGGPVGGVLGGLGSGNGVGSLNGLVFERGLLGRTPPSIAQSAAESVNALGLGYDMSGVSPGEIENYRKARLRALIDANRTTLDRDPEGQPVRKHELIATNPDNVSIAIAARAGFRVIGIEQEPELGIRLVTLAIPQQMNVRQALKVIRSAAPAMQVDFNHVYQPSGGNLLPVAGASLAAPSGARTGVRIAMIDGGIASHPSLARASIEQRGFSGEPQPTGHGTAVGSLLVGQQGPFRGAARGAQLFVGDVYGGNPAAGSVTSIVRALNWAASKNPSVINISLVGAGNAVLARAIAGVRGRGIQVVAAVGNDGPAAPPQYPASYPGVVSVTGVDAQGRALPEAGKAAHLDFAAPGADMIAASPGQGYTTVRGTSFAAPLAAARLAISGSYQRLALEARPGKGRVGRGIVCGECRIDPKIVRGR